nr:GntR family transcriptional regulator [Glycomyces mayteni]
MAASIEPPYARIAGELSRRIADRELLPGDRVPSTRQVAQEFGVALATATKALDVLRSEGLVVTRPRSGTVVAPRRGAKGRARGGADAGARGRGGRGDRRRRRAGGGLDARGGGAVRVAPMSLYRFVEDKEQLVELMGDTVYGSREFTVEESDPWRAQVESIARELWRLHRAHPWLGRIQPLTRPLPLPGIIRLGDRLLGALEPLGLPPRRQFDVHLLLYTHVVGLAVNVEREDEAMSLSGVSSEEWTDLQYLPKFGDDAFMSSVPHFARLFGPAGSMSDGYDMDLDALFELGLGVILDGVEALAARSE